MCAIDIHFLTIDMYYAISDKHSLQFINKPIIEKAKIFGYQHTFDHQVVFFLNIKKINLDVIHTKLNT